VRITRSKDAHGSSADIAQVGNIAASRSKALRQIGGGPICQSAVRKENSLTLIRALAGYTINPTRPRCLASFRESLPYRMKEN